METLIYMIDWGCIDVNPWASRVSAPESPDFIWLDLDPAVSKKSSREQEDKGFQKAVEAALAAREVLSGLKIKSFVKTSGKTGMHIYIPVTGISFSRSRAAAEKLAAKIRELVPDISTTEESISHRRGRVYLDAHQNDYADTLAAPYAVRPYHEPLVSTPLEWKEVKPGLDRYSYTIQTIGKRVAKKGDLFAGVSDPRIAASNTRRLSPFLS